MPLHGALDWDEWAHFLQATQRESLIARRVRAMLEGLGVLPAPRNAQQPRDAQAPSAPPSSVGDPRVLDVGCGNGEFTAALACNSVAIDIVDFRCELARQRLPMVLGSFEELASGAISLPLSWSAPDVIIFKQSFHLVSRGHELLRYAFPRATVVLIQAVSRPWDGRPYEHNGDFRSNVRVFEAAGRSVNVAIFKTRYVLTPGAAEAFIVGGAQSDLRAMTVDERKVALAHVLEEAGPDGPTLTDELAVVVAGPMHVLNPAASARSHGNYV